MVVDGVKVDEVAALEVLLTALRAGPVVARDLEGHLVRNRICTHEISMRTADRLLRKNARTGFIRWNKKERVWTMA